MQRIKRKATERPGGLSKYQRYRMLQQRKGMKLLRVWVPDTNRSDFAKEAERQARLLANRPEEKEALNFIGAAFEWPEP